MSDLFGNFGVLLFDLQFRLPAQWHTPSDDYHYRCMRIISTLIHPHSSALKMASSFGENNLLKAEALN
jgi:hypothetical protein